MTFRVIIIIKYNLLLQKQIILHTFAHIYSGLKN